MTTSETSPLLPQYQHPSTSGTSTTSRAERANRTVTFNPLATVTTYNTSPSSSPPLTDQRRGFGNSIRPTPHQDASAKSYLSAPAGTGLSTSQPMLSALNSRLRRRNSYGAPLDGAGHRGGGGLTAGTLSKATTATQPSAKIGPQRTTKNTQKLKLLPDLVRGEGEEDETAYYDDDAGFSRDVYSQLTRIKEPSARRDAARLGKADRDRLPRVTAYCTASSYRLDGVIKFLKSRAKTRGASPKLFDECVYSPFDYDYEAKQARQQAQEQQEEEEQQEQPSQHDAQGDSLQSSEPLPQPTAGSERRFSDSVVETGEERRSRTEDLIDLQENGKTSSEAAATSEQPSSSSNEPAAVATSGDNDDDDDINRLDTTVHTPEIFIFDYGTVVIWGMTPAQEARFLADISKFALSALRPEDTQVENFNFYYARDYQARIYNDFISLREPRNYMIKLAISHALSQSVKTSLFEDLVSETIAATAPLPAQIAKTGSVNMSRRQINMQIGELFILRINIHLQGSVLDSPELMWAEPQLDPVYQAVRTYLEMDQRVGLLTERLDVIADLLAVLKDQLSHRHGEYLEWIGRSLPLCTTWFVA